MLRLRGADEAGRDPAWRQRHPGLQITRPGTPPLPGPPGDHETGTPPLPGSLIDSATRHPAAARLPARQRNPPPRRCPDPCSTAQPATPLLPGSLLDSATRHPAATLIPCRPRNPPPHCCPDPCRAVGAVSSTGEGRAARGAKCRFSPASCALAVRDRPGVTAAPGRDPDRCLRALRGGRGRDRPPYELCAGPALGPSLTPFRYTARAVGALVVTLGHGLAWCAPRGADRPSSG